jgi:glycosyltransferase involved in cell wall biosynthesis
LAEGFGHAILEAMSCGVPVITTPHTCGRDLIEDGVNGYIVPIRDVDAIVRKLEGVLSHRNLLGALSREARLTALAFTWDRFRQKIRQVYRSRAGVAL